MSAKSLNANLIIHCFAAAHAVATIILRHLGVADDIVLTLLTITMIFMVARLYDQPMEVSAVIALLCCFAGFWLGTKGAELIEQSGWELLNRFSNVITTIIVSEVLGWSTYFISSRMRRKKRSR